MAVTVASGHVAGLPSRGRPKRAAVPQHAIDSPDQCPKNVHRCALPVHGMDLGGWWGHWQHGRWVES